MIKMLVVEDEAIMREGICCVGDWESYDVEISGVAENGKEALGQIELCRPDIVLTDVVMPVMDGIELARQVYEKYPEIRMIFLSGHEEFEYVKRAMEYKVCNYLLKPAKIERIVEVVTEVRDEILKERERIAEEERLQKKLELSMPVLREHYMNQILEGTEWEEEKIKKQFGFFNIDLDPKNIAVLVCEPDIEEEKEASQIVLLQLKEICQEIVGCEYRSVVFSDLEDRAVTVLNYPQKLHTRDLLPYLQGKAMRIQKEMEERCGQSVSIGIGRPIRNIRYLHKAYKEAEYALSYRFFMGRKSVIYIGDIEKEEPQELFYIEQKEGEVVECVRVGDLAGTKRQLEIYFASLGKYAGCGQDFIYEEVTVFISNLLRFLKGKVLDGETDFLQELEKLLDELRRKNSYTTLSELQNQVESILGDIAEKINENRLLRNEGIIEKAKKYVQENLSGDVTLITVAEKVYVSPNYLSCLFKESGENFKDYVIRIKMEKAEEMMAADKYTLSQIAAALGYRDGRYFSQVYKKYKNQQ